MSWVERQWVASSLWWCWLTSSHFKSVHLTTHVSPTSACTMFIWTSLLTMVQAKLPAMWSSASARVTTLVLLARHVLLAFTASAPAPSSVTACHANVKVALMIVTGTRVLARWEICTDNNYVVCILIFYFIYCWAQPSGCVCRTVVTTMTARSAWPASRASTRTPTRAPARSVPVPWLCLLTSTQAYC